MDSAAGGRIAGVNRLTETLCAGSPGSGNVPGEGSQIISDDRPNARASAARQRRSSANAFPRPGSEDARLGRFWGSVLEVLLAVVRRVDQAHGLSQPLLRSPLRLPAFRLRDVELQQRDVHGAARA